MTAAHAVPHDRRAHPRRRVFKKVKAVFNANSSVLDCTMKDISLGGARLACALAAQLPEHFVLVFMAEREMRDVRVVWRKFNELGVEFLSPPRQALHLLL